MFIVHKSCFIIIEFIVGRHLVSCVICHISALYCRWKNDWQRKWYVQDLWRNWCTSWG